MKFLNVSVRSQFSIYSNKQFLLIVTLRNYQTTFIEKPEGCICLGQSKSVVCIRQPDSNRSIIFSSDL